MSIIKIAHVVSIITLVRIITFARVENIRKPRAVIIIEIAILEVAISTAPFVNPLEPIRIFSPSTVVDTIIETPSGDETSCLTIFS